VGIEGQRGGGPAGEARGRPAGAPVRIRAGRGPPADRRRDAAGPTGGPITVDRIVSGDLTDVPEQATELLAAWSGWAAPAPTA